MLRSPLLRDVCVVGVREVNSFHYREVVAVVVPEKKTQKLNAITTAIEPLLKNLPSFKKPARVVISSENLPRTSMGELKRHEVLAWLRQTSELGHS